MRHFLVIVTVLLFSCQTQTKHPIGGFDYPTNLANEDTNLYFYQVRDSLPKSYGYLLHSAYRDYKPFDEPNLSIKPQEKETFRLTYSEAFGYTTIISLTEDHIIIKKGNPKDFYKEDTSHLTSVENFHLNFLKNNFPVETTSDTRFNKQKLDSLVELYPQLLDPNYYYMLYDKAIFPNPEKFTYAETKIKLTKQQYNSLIKEINASGFWSMPFREESKGITSDGSAYSLEANTKKKYKVVFVGVNPGDATKLTKACQKLIEVANLDKEIGLIYSGKSDIEVKDYDLPDVKE